MNRRGFLKFLAVAPVTAPVLASTTTLPAVTDPLTIPRRMSFTYIDRSRDWYPGQVSTLDPLFSETHNYIDKLRVGYFFDTDRSAIIGPVIFDDDADDA